MDTNTFSPRQLSGPELESLEAQVRKLSGSPDDLMLVWKELNDYFQKATVQDIWNYRYDFFRWYTEISFKYLNNFNDDFLVKIFDKQAALASVLDFDVLSKITWYFYFKCYDDQTMQSLYIKIRDSFLTSDAIIGIWENEPVTLARIVKDYRLLKNSTNTLKSAEFLSKLKNILFPNDSRLSNFIFSNPDEAVNKFVELINFFTDVEPEEVAGIIEFFVHPDRFEETETEKKIPNPSAVASVTVKPDLKVIKSQISSQFKKNAQGEFENVEGVLGKLNELSEKYNDPKISELYYFDETDGKFKWTI